MGVEDPDAIPEMDGSCCDSRTDSFRLPRTEGLHEDNVTRVDEDEHEDASSVAFDDVSFYVGPGEGFVSSDSVCESDISVTDDEGEEDDFSLFDDLSDDDEDVSICYSREKSVILENPHLLVRKPLKESVECDAVPAMRPIDSFGSMSSEYTVDDTVNGFEVTLSKNKGTSTQSRSNAVWSLF